MSHNSRIMKLDDHQKRYTQQLIIVNPCVKLHCCSKHWGIQIHKTLLMDRQCKISVSEVTSVSCEVIPIDIHTNSTKMLDKSVLIHHVGLKKICNIALLRDTRSKWSFCDSNLITQNNLIQHKYMSTLTNPPVCLQFKSRQIWSVQPIFVGRLLFQTFN